MTPLDARSQRSRTSGSRSEPLLDVPGNAGAHSSHARCRRTSGCATQRFPVEPAHAAALVDARHCSATCCRPYLPGSRARASWRFVRGDAGRPAAGAAVRRAGLRFNLAHTRGLVAHGGRRAARRLAWMWSATTRRVPLEVARRYFSPVEVAALEALARRRAAAAISPAVDAQGGLSEGHGHGRRRRPGQHDVSNSTTPARVTFERAGDPRRRALVVSPVRSGRATPAGAGAIAARSRRCTPLECAWIPAELHHPRASGPLARSGQEERAQP